LQRSLALIGPPSIGGGSVTARVKRQLTRNVPVGRMEHPQVAKIVFRQDSLEHREIAAATKIKRLSCRFVGVAE
jgi:hypothetical protein